MNKIVIPYLRSAKNRLKRRRRGFVIRDLILLSFAFFIAYTLYFGVSYSLNLLSTFSLIGYVSAHQLLGMIFFPFLFLLFSSALALSFGTFFVSEDNEMLCASPVSPRTFFLGKSLLVLLGTLWMPIVFIVPIIVAFGNHYHTSVTALLLGAGGLFPFLCIPVYAAVGLSITLVRCVPRQWYRYVGIGFAGLLFYLFYSLGDLLLGKVGSFSSSEIFKYIDKLSKINPPLSPSYWYTIFLGTFLEKNEILSIPLELLIVVALALLGLSYLIFLLFYRKAFSKSLEGRVDSKILKKNFYSPVINVFVGRVQGALILKELLAIKRDMGQVVQLGVLGIIVSVYLLNLKVIGSIPLLQLGSVKNLDPLLQLLNLCMAAFVVTAICTRLVFPSLSIEGRQVWLLQSAPLPLKRFINAKFIGWVIPVGLLSMVLFGLGSYVVVPQLNVLIFSSLLGVSISVAVVGLALYTGAFFANFSWEYQSQLIAGVGNFVFMLCSVVLIFASLSVSFMNLFLPTTSTLILMMSSGDVIFNFILGFYFLFKAEKSLALRLQERM